jgi:hypothetical protein
MTSTVEKTELPRFGEREVDRASVKITGAGTGLSDALELDPVALDIGEEVFFVMRGITAGVEHSEDKNELLVRIHKVHTEEISFMDREMAEKILGAQAEEIQRRKDEIEGQMRLDALQAEKDAEERERRDSNMGGPA